MLTFEYSIPSVPISSYLPQIPLDSLCFFDIETTGFSPDTSSVYLIGCMYQKGENWQLIQWFADDYSSEKELLLSFFQHIKSFRWLIHYNGTTFDVPYLEKKCRHYCIQETFPPSIKMLDLYKILRPYQPFFRLSHMRQKNLEEYLGIHREDTFSGKDLISLYSEYMQSKILDSGAAKKLLFVLLLHNKEDVICMLSLCTLLAFPMLFPFPGKNSFYYPQISRKEGKKTGGNNTPPEEFCNRISLDSVSYENCRLSLNFSLPFSFPVKEDYPCGAFLLFLEGKNGFLQVEAQEDTLYYFYPDYKNYYFLPEEDTAIHKSIAPYVDAPYREKATAATCYTKMEGEFLPCFSYSKTAVLYQSYKAKQGYLSVSDDWLSNRKALHAYLCDILYHFSEEFPII